MKSFAPAGKKALTDRASAVRAGGLPSITPAILSGSLSTKTQTSRPLAKSLIRASLLATPVEGYVRACLALAGADDPMYGDIQAQTMILSGKEDKACSEVTVQFLQGAIKGAKAVVLEDVGHWHLVEDWEATAKEMKRFLEG